MNNNEFALTEKLYHYTSMDNSIKILLSDTLLFSSLQNLNDINELYRPPYFDTFNEEVVKAAYDEINKYQQISLTHDDKKKRLGFDIPAMWGHYGERGNGVCIVFNKKRLIDVLPQGVVFKKEICYTDNYSSAIDFKSKGDSINSFTKREIKEYFFKKTRDWSYEQEYRILAKSHNKEQLKITIKDALVAIIMHRDKTSLPQTSLHTSNSYKILNTLLKDKVIIYRSFYDERLLFNFENDGKTIWSSKTGYKLDDNN